MIYIYISRYLTITYRIYDMGYGISDMWYLICDMHRYMCHMHRTHNACFKTIFIYTTYIDSPHPKKRHSLLVLLRFISSVKCYKVGGYSLVVFVCFCLFCSVTVLFVLSECHYANMLLCHHVTNSPCHFVSVSFCHYVSMLLCHNVSVPLCH